MDSDYELEDDDDDLFEDFVDGDVDEGVSEKKTRKLKGADSSMSIETCLITCQMKILMRKFWTYQMKRVTVTV